MILIWLLLPCVILFVVEVLLVARTELRAGCFVVPGLAAAAALIAWLESTATPGWDGLEWGIYAVLAASGLIGALLGGLLGWDIRRCQDDRRAMKAKTVLRVISLVMLIVAVAFVVCALSNPTLGSAVYIGGFRFGAAQWRVCYAVYATVMALLFVISFFVPRKNK